MLPLEGINDYVDLNLIVNPWQAIVAVAVIFALLIWPQMSARQTAKRVEKSLTQNNGGQSVKDYLDRNEAANAALSKKLDDHITWSEGYRKATDDRLVHLEARRKVGLFHRKARR